MKSEKVIIALKEHPGDLIDRLLLATINVELLTEKIEAKNKDIKRLRECKRIAEDVEND